MRDELLGRPVRDVDVAVAGDPAGAARALAERVRGPVFRLSEAFGAWRVIDRRAERVYDFAPLQGDSIESDLRQRDFTDQRDGARDRARRAGRGRRARPRP